MASKSKIAHQIAEVRQQMEWMLARVENVPSGSPASDNAAELLSDLKQALVSFDQRSVDIANAVFTAQHVAAAE